MGQLRFRPQNSGYQTLVKFLVLTDTFLRQIFAKVPTGLGVLKMAVSFPRFSWWLWSGSKKKELISNGSSFNSVSSSYDSDFGLREPETLVFPTRIASTRREGRGKWLSDEGRRIDRESDIVVVSSEGLYASECESDGPDWSIGWEEPHGPGFLGDNETDGGFAVLVPCYGPGCKGLADCSTNKLLNALKNFPSGLSSDGNKSVQQWFSSLQNFSMPGTGYC